MQKTFVKGVPVYEAISLHECTPWLTVRQITGLCILGSISVRYHRSFLTQVVYMVSSVG